ncbi:glycoside hydrolase family 16 protein [Serpula lacrymans var. lacrymans S7.3]|uniref:Glycoside hydrolase family 16 protein n=2 Tax=Serpula lacrymans var. lacrymans TaxID=341189 RepID=F8Q281_SERL3|nr:glycoside hydrolase family 16 protein [Serpula lacrymans var. lacrymans S7.9]EGN97292.1 glycoside hydrolase family 16 protein [Serpula lacrymans var. lacrymans S7.3]EGO22882.1 glycoside hydrolase family 16 protein [Serpula lacrymans var. lacrymans S7.9]
MKFSPSTGALTVASLAGSALAGTYNVADNIVGNGFYNSFGFEAIADPTAGRVNYVDLATAQSLNLTYTNGNSFVIRADDTTVLTASGPGRNSVRVKSNTAYTTHAAIFGIAHMPEGCGSWPAVWETNESNWPAGGEVDIVEGVNNVAPNQATLHTSPGCTIPSSGGMLGTVVSTNCDSNANGCSIQLTEDNNSFGPGFNGVGGGWYAVERTNSAISVWFWERGSTSVPSQVSSGASSIDTSTWGTPDAYFPSTSCDISTMFDANNIIINLTFCGSWAGKAATYSASGCPSDCISYVNANPSAFTNAYFEFNAINVYT